MSFLETKFAKIPEIMEANKAAFRAGLELRRGPPRRSPVQYEVKAVRDAAGRHTGTSPATPRWPTGWSRPPGAPACRCSSVPTRSRRNATSDILHELAKHKRFGVRTFQAEDEIGGVGAALGAAFGGALGVSTTTSGPGMVLKQETIPGSRWCPWNCR